MKKLSFFIAIYLLFCRAMFAQVSVSADGSAADPSAMLDVRSTSRGMLVPRMSITERNGISQPATGLLIFCTDDKQYYTNKGTTASPDWVIVSSQWLTVGSNIYYTAGNVGIGVSPAYPLHFASNLGDKISLYGSGSNHYGIGIQDYMLQIHSSLPGTDVVFGYGCSASLTETMRIKGTGQVGIGTGAPVASAILDVASTTRGFLPPRMTKTQRNAIGSPASGLVIYQTDNTPGFYYYSGSHWVSLTSSGAGGNSPSMCIDYDNNAYPTFTIGTHTWMAENLRVTHYRNGDVIPNVTANGAWDALTSGAYCWYNNDQGTNAKYGTLYNWYAVVDSRGLCPAGWHVPSDAEWTAFAAYLGTEIVAGGKMKSVSALWISPNTDATNNSGFSGLPGGTRYDAGPFVEIGYIGYWWSSTEYSTDIAWQRHLDYSNGYVITGFLPKAEGVSVRCLRD